MAKNGKQYTKIAGTWEQIKPSYTDLVDVPTDFNPSTHDHTLSEITDAGTVAAIDTNASTTQFLRGDGTWATPADTDTNTVTSIRRDNTGTYRTGNINLVGGTNVAITETSAGVFSFSSTDTNTVYTHPTHPGDDINIDTGALTGATVISDLDFNITSDTLGHITDANATIATRTLTATDISLGNVTNESKATMFSSPSFTGTPTAPTASSSVNNTQIATTAFVTNKLAGVAGGLNFKGTISLSGGKNGSQLSSAGLIAPGDYLIVTTAGDLVAGGIFGLIVQPPGDESDSTLPVTLEIGDWIFYQEEDGINNTLTVTILNNNDASKAAAVHTHTIANVTGLQTAIDGKVAKAGDTMTGDLSFEKEIPRITLNMASDAAGNGGRIIFADATSAQDVQLRYNHFDSERPPFGLVVERGPGNTSTDKSYLQVQGEIYADSTQRVFHDGFHPNADTWTTARTLTIGNTGKSVNGSGNVSWSLAEIGAYAASNPSGYITSSGSISGNAATATSAPLLSALSNYAWSASTNGRDFALGIQTSFVRAADGYPEYGSAVRVKTYGNDGGAAELYFPYSSDYGGTSMRYRLGQYNNAGWTAWKTVVDSDNIGSQSVNYATSAGSTTGNAATATKLATARNIALTGAVTGNANFDGSGNISIATTNTADPTLTINGDASGSATFTNLGNATLTLAIADNSHNHSSVTDFAPHLYTTDNRTIAPSEDSAFRMKFGFTSWNNNNTSPWADYLHLRSYSDGSGGSDNLVMFKKTGIGMRIWQQSFGSGTAYSNYVDVWDSGNLTNLNQLTNGPGYITSSASITGNAATATALQTTRSINGTNFNGTANITTANWGTARTLTIGNTGKSVNGSGNVSWSLGEIGAYAASNPSGYTTNTGTVTSVATGGGLTGGTITTSGTISHADTSTQASVDNSGNTFIQDITLDTYGHITAITSATANNVSNADTVDGYHAVAFVRNVYSEFLDSAFPAAPLTTTFTSWSKPTGMPAVTLEANSRYYIFAAGSYYTAITTTGIGISPTFSTVSGQIRGGQIYINTSTSTTAGTSEFSANWRTMSTSGGQTGNFALGTTGPTALPGNEFGFYGIVETSGNSTVLSMHIRSEVNGSEVRVNRIAITAMKLPI